MMPMRRKTQASLQPYRTPAKDTGSVRVDGMFALAVETRAMLGRYFFEVRMLSRRVGDSDPTKSESALENGSLDAYRKSWRP